MTALLVAAGMTGCMASASGVTIGSNVGKPGQLVDLEKLGTPPPAVAMCQEGEPGCIETGWGPGWDMERGREGVSWRRVSARRCETPRGSAMAMRVGPAIERPCVRLWDDGCGTAPPFGDCER